MIQIDEEVRQIDAKLKFEGHGCDVNVNPSGWAQVHNMCRIIVSELWEKENVKVKPLLFSATENTFIKFLI